MPIKLNWCLQIKPSDWEAIDYDNVPGAVWIRCLQLIPFLKKLGIQNTVNQYSTYSDISLFVRWQNDDAYKTAIELKSKGQKIIFDLNVNYFDKVIIKELDKMSNNAGPVTQSHIDDCHRMLEISDLVICASEYIASKARKYHPNVICLPDSINREHFNLNKDINEFLKLEINAIWSGVKPKYIELKQLLPILNKHKIELKIISDREIQWRKSVFPWFRYTRLHNMKWSYNTFPQNILKGEICVAPRKLDNTYNMGHSFFKIGVFLAQGIPALASPVPSYKEILQNNFNGRICNNLIDWKMAIEEIADTPKILLNWSRNAEKSIMPFYTNKISEQYVNILNRLASF